MPNDINPSIFEPPPAPETVNPDPFLSSTEAERYLGLRPRVLEMARNRQDGRFPAFYRIGGKSIKYRLSELKEWLAKNRVDHSQRGV
jgi:predicted DNA-binding transcriptional regulator AlpA